MNKLLHEENKEDKKTEEDLLKYFEKGIIKNLLNIIILLRIKCKATLSGYDLLEHTQEKYKIKLSAGTIYYQLYSLERKHLVEGAMDSSGKRLYSLTPDGLKATDIILSSKKQIERVIALIFEE